MSVQKYLVEFIGTFFLVFTIGCVTLISSLGNLAPLAIGSALTALVYAGGHISGAHYNPAITISIWIRGKCPATDVLPYILLQLLGAVFAAILVLFLDGMSIVPAEGDVPLPALESGQMVRVLIAEFLFTFALAYVILNVATAERTEGNSYYGLAIGLTVMAGAFAVGPITGAAFNPAVLVAICLMRLVAWVNVWIYLVAIFSGGIVAALAFQFVNGSDKD